MECNDPIRALLWLLEHGFGSGMSTRLWGYHSKSLLVRSLGHRGLMPRSHKDPTAHSGYMVAVVCMILLLKSPQTPSYLQASVVPSTTETPLAYPLGVTFVAPKTKVGPTPAEYPYCGCRRGPHPHCTLREADASLAIFGRVTWCHRVCFSCYLRQNNGTINVSKFKLSNSRLFPHIRCCSVEPGANSPKFTQDSLQIQRCEFRCGGRFSGGTITR